MTVTSPNITVLMAVYNGGPYVGEAVASILKQTYPYFRFLILDDASTDNSREIIRAFKDPRIDLVILQNNVGQTAALNKGLQMIETPYVARMDADDIALPDRLEKQLNYMVQHPEIALLGSGGYIINSAGHVVQSYNVIEIDSISIRWRHCSEGGAFFHSSVMFKRDVIWNDLKGYDEKFSYCQDFDLFSRVLQIYPAANLPDRLIKYRIHPASMTVKMRNIGIQEVLQVKCRNCRKAFSDQEISSKELDFFLNADNKKDRAKEYLKIYQKILAAFQKTFPGTIRSMAFRNVVANQYACLARNNLRTHPALAVHFMFKGIKYSPVQVMLYILMCAVGYLKPKDILIERYDY